MMPRYCYGPCWLVALLTLGGCASGPLKINLMPAPEVYEDGVYTPFTDFSAIADEDLYQGMLYATDRAPADPVETGGRSSQRFYENDRGYLLRLGLAEIQLGADDLTWEEARRISLAKNRSERYPLRVTGIEEFGILDRSFHGFETPELLSQKSPKPGVRFADLVNRKLAVSSQKDVFIYVHGYKVVFENPLLVATELWHYLGYDGVFIAYAWPSTPSRWAYFSDAETTTATAFHLRALLEFLVDSTAVERIHIIGYSQGTRLVAETLFNLALKHHDTPRDQVLRDLRIGNIVLVGSDIDSGVMGTYIQDGLLNVPEHLALYVSEKDLALDLSSFLLGRDRVGQMFAPGEMELSTVAFLESTPEISVINVTGAADATRGNGHDYFRSSPWVSSDILMLLKHGLAPAQRGLEQADDEPVWHFTPDYVDRLRRALRQTDPSIVLPPTGSAP